MECSTLAGSAPGEAEGQAKTVWSLASRLCVSPQALDEEYLKVDAQFGGVDQRKIFTFAEKVRNGGIFATLGPEGGLGHSQIHWERHVGFWLTSQLSVLLLLLCSHTSLAVTLPGCCYPRSQSYLEPGANRECELKLNEAYP